MANPIGGQLGIKITEDVVSAEAVGGINATGNILGRVLGQEVATEDAGLYTNVKAGSAITVNQFVGIDENFLAYPLTKAMADDGWFIGIAQTALTKDRYGWVARRGSNISGNLLNGCAADVALYTSGTAGSLDDESSGTTKIDGVVAVVTVSASGAGAYEILATWPKSTTF